MLNRYRNLSSTTRIIFIVVAVALVLLALYGFFTSETGRMISLLCCGGVTVLVVVGIISENGMRR